jgi:hypothetical protein
LRTGTAAEGIGAVRSALDTGAPGVYPVIRQDAGFLLAGKRVNELLVESCNVNFAEIDPQERVVVMTQMIGVSVLVIRDIDKEIPRYRIWCDPPSRPISGRHCRKSPRIWAAVSSAWTAYRGRRVRVFSKLIKGSIGVMSPQSARKYLKDNKVKYILAQFVDIHGAAKAKAVPVEHLDMMLNEGAGFAGFALWGFGMGPHGPDYMAIGDPSTLSVIPWMPGFARMACYGHVNGAPLPILFARRAEAPTRCARQTRTHHVYGH